LQQAKEEYFHHPRPPSFSSQSIEAVIFDLDGVLLDNARIYFEAAEYALSKASVEDPDRASLMRFVRGLELGKKSTFVLDSNRRRELFLSNYGRVWNRLCPEKSSVIPSAMQTLRALKEAEISTAIVTARQMRLSQIKTQLEQLGLRAFFDVVIPRERVRKVKPFPDQLLAASFELDLPACRCVAVGDTPLDIIAARNAGMHSIAVRSGIYAPFQLLRERPTELLHSVGELGFLFQSVYSRV